MAFASLPDTVLTMVPGPVLVLTLLIGVIAQCMVVVEALLLHATEELGCSCTLYYVVKP